MLMISYDTGTRTNTALRGWRDSQTKVQWFTKNHAASEHEVYLICAAQARSLCICILGEYAWITRLMNRNRSPTRWRQWCEYTWDSLNMN